MVATVNRCGHSLATLAPTAFGLALACAFTFGLALSFPAQAQSIEVVVHKEGQRVTVDVTAPVAAEPEHVWSTLTDFDHMADFLSALKSSRVISHKGLSMEVEQAGEARRGFFHFSFSTVRSVELVPEREVRSQLISGDSFKSYEFVTRIVPAGNGMTTIVHHGEYV